MIEKDSHTMFQIIFSKRKRIIPLIINPHSQHKMCADLPVRLIVNCLRWKMSKVIMIHLTKCKELAYHNSPSILSLINTFWV